MTRNVSSSKKDLSSSNKGLMLVLAGFTAPTTSEHVSQEVYMLGANAGESQREAL